MCDYILHYMAYYQYSESLRRCALVRLRAVVALFAIQQSYSYHSKCTFFRLWSNFEHSLVVRNAPGNFLPVPRGSVACLPCLFQSCP